MCVYITIFLRNLNVHNAFKYLVYFLSLSIIFFPVELRLRVFYISRD